jgi:hypothetical protein
MTEMDFLKMLDLQDSLPETSQAQKLANEDRRKHYLYLNRDKGTSEPTVFTDFIIQRLENPTKLLSPNTIIAK